MYKNIKTFYNPKLKYWHGNKNILSIYNADISCGQAILHVLRQNPNKITQICAKTGSTITNKEMVSLSIRVAQNLLLRGYEQDDVIGIIASNSHYLAPVVFGAFICSTPISSLDPSFGIPDIKHMYGITKPKLIFCDADCYDNVKQSVTELNLNCTIFTLKGKIPGVGNVEEFFENVGDEDEFLPPNLKEGGDQTAAIVCSSGTTGLSKGVCIPHAGLLNNSISTVTHDDVLFCYSSLYWLSGLFILMYGTLNGATRIIIDETFSIDKCLDIIEKYQVTLILTPPSQLGQIVQSLEIKPRYLSSIRLFLVGGSYVQPSLSSKIQSYLPNGHIIVGYGMSEIFKCCTMDTTKEKIHGSTGYIVSNTDMKIIDQEGNNLGIGEKGEILIRISFKWPGYYGDPEATKKILDKDGWLHSGDLGYFDENGFLFVVDRIKDILKYKNFHFYPVEIEATILEIDGVAEVSVCGIPDVIFTDLPATAIIKKPNSKLSEQEVYDYVANKMSDFKQLRGGVYFLDSFPKTASGKVQRNKLKEILIKLYEKRQ